jgi:hypothetical protein
MRSALVFVALLFVTSTLQAQPGRQVPPIEVKPAVPPIVDSVRHEDYYTQPNPDSARRFDSLYAIRKAEILERMSKQPYTPHEDFISVKIGASAFGRIRAGELQRYFAERVGHTDLDEEESALTGIDRLFWIGAEAAFSPTWGVAAEYSYTGRWFQTNVDTSADVSRIPLGSATLDLTSHSFVVGPYIVPFDTRFVRSKLFAGIGPAVTIVREFEQAKNVERDASATGLAIVFEAEFDFRVIDELSFGLSLFTRQQMTGKLTTDTGDLSDPFGTRQWRTVTAPDASYINGGLGLSLHYYF